MVLGFLYIIGRSRSGATLALKMMYPIDTWSSAEPTADFIRLIAVTVAAGLMAMPMMKVVGKGMLRLHRSNSASTNGNGSNYFRCCTGLVYNWIYWNWCSNYRYYSRINSTSCRNKKKSRNGHYHCSNYDLHILSSTRRVWFPMKQKKI